MMMILMARCIQMVGRCIQLILALQEMVRKQSTLNQRSKAINQFQFFLANSKRANDARGVMTNGYSGPNYGSSTCRRFGFKFSNATIQEIFYRWFDLCLYKREPLLPGRPREDYTELIKFIAMTKLFLPTGTQLTAKPAPSSQGTAAVFDRAEVAWSHKMNTLKGTMMTAMVAFLTQHRHYWATERASRAKAGGGGSSKKQAAPKPLGGVYSSCVKYLRTIPLSLFPKPTGVSDFCTPEHLCLNVALFHPKRAK